MDRFRTRAQLLFGLLVVVALIGAWLVIVLPGDIPAVARGVALAGLALAIAAYIALIRALGDGRDWSMTATIWVCVLLVVAGVVQVVYDLTRSTLTFPLGAILALFVLAVRPPPAAMPILGPAARRARALVVGALVVSMAGPALLGVLVNGQALAVGPEDVDVHVALECPAPVAAFADRARAVGVDTTWQFRRHEPFPPSHDGIVIRWDTNEGPDEAEVQLVVSSWEPTDAIWRGNATPASALTAPLIQDGPSEEYGIDVEGHGQVDGHIRQELLVPAGFTGELTVWAMYAHGDRWLTASNQVSCSFET
jgi:hypothetical protein